jgi:hypothetical protein
VKTYQKGDTIYASKSHWHTQLIEGVVTKITPTGIIVANFNAGHGVFELRFKSNGMERTTDWHPYRVVEEGEELVRVRRAVEAEHDASVFRSHKEKLSWVPGNPKDAETRLEAMLTLVRKWK